MKYKDIEEFFLNTLLRVCIAGALAILLADIVLAPEDVTSLKIDIVILAASLTAYAVRTKYPTVSTLIITSFVLLSMLYQTLEVPLNRTTSFSIILIVGFIFSVMLKGWLRWFMHGFTFIALQSIFFYQYVTHQGNGFASLNDFLAIVITYSILYLILTYSSGVWKVRYDKLTTELREANRELQEKADEIEAQNEELRQAQDNLNLLNADLERLVSDRTRQIQYQNEMLIKVSYANAHHLRGPVARMMGLVSIYKLDPDLNSDFVMGKLIEQAHEIDQVIRKISVDLENTIGKD